MAEGGTKKMSCGYIINGRMNNNRRQLLQSKPKRSVSWPGRATSSEGRQGKICSRSRLFCGHIQKNMYILYTENNITTEILPKINLVYI